MANYYMKCCDVIWIDKNKFISHKQICEKHHSFFTQNQNKYCCDICKFSTKRQNDIIRHLTTNKHLLNVENINSNYKCKNCDKTYKKYQSLYYHKKKCVPKENVMFEKVEPTQNELLTCLITENKEYINELKNLVLEQRNYTNQIMDRLFANQQITSNNINNTVTNNNNTQFNINMFLNEKCKDAMNLSEFIENLQVTNEHLDNNAQNGFVNGVTKIITDGLQELNVYSRPIHCTDSRRETIFVKEDNEWKKEESDKKLRSAIQEVSRKGLLQFCQWKEENPNYVDLDSELGLKYIAIHLNSMAGAKRDEYYPKIIRALAKETFIDKKEYI